MKKVVSIGWVLILLLTLAPSPALAQGEVQCALEVIVQRDDWLSKLADKFYGDIFAYPVIAEATNAKAAVDESFARIDDVDFIEIGWKLCIVNIETAEAMLGSELDATQATVEDGPVNLNGVIKIGAVQTLSGPLAAYGQSIGNGVDLAVKEINGGDFLGEAVLEVVWEDEAGDRERAVNAFDKLINQDQVTAILGPTLSNSAFAADPLAQRAGVPVIGSSNTVSSITTIGNYIFRTSLSEADIIPHTIQVVKASLNLQNVAVMYGNDNAFTQSGYEIFTQALADEGIEVIATETFATGDADFSAQLTTIQAQNPDALVLSALTEEAAGIMIQARQLGITAPFIGGSGFNSPHLLQLGGDAVNGAIYGAAWDVNEPSPANQKFVADFQAEYGVAPDQFAAQSYTAVWTLVTAIREADSTDRAVIRDALDGLDIIASPLGPFTFTDGRTPDHPAVVQMIDDGSFNLFQ